MAKPEGLGVPPMGQWTGLEVWATNLGAVQRELQNEERLIDTVKREAALRSQSAQIFVQKEQAAFLADCGVSLDTNSR